MKQDKEGKNNDETNYIIKANIIQSVIKIKKLPSLK